ncbi:MAG: amidohydrolase family protein, partial [Alphaproteobacteria bacterium]|nr:amidohydrolase family protein [Alphaproteobacteria bacterium]
MTKRFFAKHVLTSKGWLDNARIALDQTGAITAIEPNQNVEPSDHILGGPAIPAMHNLHSHAFQRAMSGLSEIKLKGQESFWSWREIMYKFLAHIGPEDVQNIAAQLYMECLKSGYASVGEFHYLHHAIGGMHYSNIAEHSHQIISAAKNTGIALTHLPVLYAYSGFNDAPLSKAQERFKTDPEMILKIIQSTEKLAKSENIASNVNVGIAPHSLRAVSMPMLQEMTNNLKNHNSEAVIHIHIAEQTKEVQD